MGDFHSASANVSGSSIRARLPRLQFRLIDALYVFSVAVWEIRARLNFFFYKLNKKPFKLECIKAR